MHTPSSQGTCEPNLTPLLDLILQILMFFMVTVNFATDQQVNADVKLPDSQTARPLSQKSDKDPIFLNLMYDHEKNAYHVEVPSAKERTMDQLRARNWLLSRYEDLKRFGDVTNSVIIRADRDADYAQVYQLLQSCAEAKFRDLKVRAIVR